MKTTLLATAAALAVTAAPLTAQTFSTGDIDIGVAFEEGAWDLHVHDEANAMEYEPADVIFQADETALQTVADASLDFIGPVGTSFFLFPQSEQAGVLFLGIGSEEIADGTFLNNQFTLTLSGFSGPGDVFLYGVDSFGAVTVYFNSANGLGAGDAITLSTGGHEHFNWAFTAPGAYEVTLTASAQLPGGEFTTSDPVTYNFAAVPEPGTMALIALGASVGLLALRRRRRK